ncbi:phosphate ABC transporter permease PstA [Streptomyces sp. NBC_00555]|uniref:phosphate ABC transporter permease PstA n=1 Tax=Streptomyces sp. NBC_00555 TaxID=2903662 RepID=UPI0022525D4A|nr:phosphate ABC transporter permease PstA [Streptomyces sp. NBC_00555]MCX5013874.1 phosphate ABC transporter permease PstA [Streptomyces sp. NBC_00555]
MTVTTHPTGPATAEDGPRTVCPAAVSDGPGAPAEHRRNTSTLYARDVLALVGAAAAALALTSLLFGRVLPFNAPLGFAVVLYLAFMALYAVLVSLDENGSAVRARLAQVFVHSIAGLLLAGLLLVVGYAIVRGWEALAHLNFFTEDMSGAGPLDPLTRGGALHAIVGTLEQIGIALVVTVPLGLACAVFLNEVPGRYARFVRTIVEAMTALPSIVAGLFVYATWILLLGNDKSGFAAALALSVMMLPIVIRASDVVIRLVPGSLKEASYALGAGQWRTVWTVVLPTARSGLTTAVILGTARGIGETSPVLLTSGIAAGLNANPFEGPQMSLPLATFNLVGYPDKTMIARGFGCAALLMALVLLLFVVARVIGGKAPGQLGRGAQHRRVLASARDAERMAARAEERERDLAQGPGTGGAGGPDAGGAASPAQPGGRRPEPPPWA